jgi:branched-chain amino acid transport system substrate-binding protein
MDRRLTLKLTVAAVASTLLVACGQQEAPKQAATPAAAPAQVVKIGFAAPLTGAQAHYGKEMQNGIVLALEEVNAEQPKLGGQPVRFELVSEDDQADPKQGASVAQKLVDARIQGMLGHFNSGTSIPASRIYMEAGIPQIAMATSPAYTTQGFKTTFRAMTSDTQQGAVAGRFMVETLKLKRIAIVDDRSAYGQGLADEFEKAAKAAGGEMIKSPNFLKLAGPAADGAIASLAGLPLTKMPGGAAYATKYKARFNMEVEVYSPYAYDAAKSLTAAMRRADSADPAKYLAELAKTKQAGVTSSNIEYDDKGDLKDGGITIYRVEGGEWKELQSVGQ